MTNPAFHHVEFRGCTLNAVTVQQLRLVEHDVKRPIVGLQGSYRPVTPWSGDTHHGGMAIDISVAGLSGTSIKALVRALRARGFAAWHRPKNWDNKGGMPHIHAILIAAPTDASPGALGQTRAYKAKPPRNGLLNNKVDNTWHPDPIPTAHFHAPPTFVGVTAYQQNCESKASGWTTGHAKFLAGRIVASGAMVVFCEELYAAQRPLFTTLLKGYKCVSVKRGKVIYIKTSVFRAVAKSAHGFELGNGKHAAGVKVQHIGTGKFLNLIVAHLSHEHEFGAQRTAEVNKLVHLVKATYPVNHCIYAGDWNDSTKATTSRPHDSAGIAMKSHGYHDATADKPELSNGSYNSANQRELPAPRAAVYLDRFFLGKGVECVGWRLDVYKPSKPAGYGADHFGLKVAFKVPL